MSAYYCWRQSLIHVAGDRADLYYNPVDHKVELVYDKEADVDPAWSLVPDPYAFVKRMWREFRESLNDVEKTALTNFLQSWGNLSYLHESGLIDKFTKMAADEAKKLTEDN